MAREVTIATVSRAIAAEWSGERQQYIDQCARLVEQAGGCKADIVCLPECFDWMGSKIDSVCERDAAAWAKSIAEPIPGPTTDRFAELAKKYRMYVCLTLFELDRQDVYVTAAILDRQGQIPGLYRKTHLTVGETMNFRARMGESLPVFELDFGRVGIVICNDINFPEVFGAMALQGAEIIFWPTQAWGPSEQIQQRLLQGRAVDYHLYVVSSTFASEDYYAPTEKRPYQGRAMIVDPDGNILADTGQRPGLVTARVDLDRPSCWWGYVGFRESGVCGEDPRFFLLERRPELYHLLCDPVENIYNTPHLVGTLTDGGGTAVVQRNWRQYLKRS